MHRKTATLKLLSQVGCVPGCRVTSFRISLPGRQHLPPTDTRQEQANLVNIQWLGKNRYHSRMLYLCGTPLQRFWRAHNSNAGTMTLFLDLAYQHQTVFTIDIQVDHIQAVVSLRQALSRLHNRRHSLRLIAALFQPLHQGISHLLVIFYHQDPPHPFPKHLRMFFDNGGFLAFLPIGG